MNAPTGGLKNPPENRSASSDSAEPIFDSNKKNFLVDLETALSEEWTDLTFEHKDTFSPEKSRQDPASILVGEENIISCDICKISFSGSMPLKQHLVSSKHYKMAQKAYMKAKYGKKYLEIKNRRESGEDGKAEQPTDLGEDDDGIEVLACDICNKICTGYICYELHIQSKSHAKKIKQNKLIKELKGNPEARLDISDDVSEEGSVYENLTQNKPIAHCQICSKKFFGPQSYQEHLSSGCHKKRVEKLNLIKKMEENGNITRNEITELTSKSNVKDAMEEDSKPFASCDICGKRFSGPEPYQQHLESNIHKKRQKQVALLDKIKTLHVKAEEDGSYHCRDCDKTLYGPEAFQQHLKSGSHVKRKTKLAMLKALRKEYPAMVVQMIASPDGYSDQEDTATEDFDKNVIILCSVCHTSFSGPESAQTHFVSQKHAKAVRYHDLAMQRRMEPLKNEVGHANNENLVALQTPS